jgi:pimeloyl-ACP methyl ester carboxylesterase/DNA-binding CsgD family transcriptional regulator
MAPPLEYARTHDGVSIAYFSLGNGPAIVFASNFWGDANMYAAPHPHTRYMTDRLVELGWRVVRYDVRGFGASQRETDYDFSLGKRMLDLEAVADKLSLRTFATAGVDAAAPVALAFAVLHPERVSRVVALNGWVNAKDRTARSPIQQALLSMNQIADEDWDFFTMALAKLVTELDDPVHTQRLADLFRRSATPATHRAFVRAFEDYDLRPLAPSIRAPVLVVHDTGFPFGSLQVCQDLAAALPDARLSVIRADPDAEIEAIDTFLRATGEAPAPGRLKADEPSTLTPRELEVLRLIAAGKTNREISDELVLSVRTVARHITNVYAKIGARGKAEATAYAIHRNLT